MTRRTLKIITGIIGVLIGVFVLEPIISHYAKKEF